MELLAVNKTVFVQSCTKDWVGRVAAIPGPYTVVLVEASWVADSGRLHEFIASGKTQQMEIEPVGQVAVQWVNWIPWPHELFTEAV